ncbi:hypothetical protein LMG31884_08860 [Xanthomonas hydrangeae]|nr:hypothetical protein LMG31884_08860 [Xanthomonas hydrangeae]CAD7713989.1 hypothetical protein LMG31884_08860 [Xanthomonas hydrangeae]CAD7721975.1 hypothetical protein LMG31887_08860 [Xanthomonas hydrangeae]CAD7721979.1 hypothetical protein LMG31887_08860 [Xanthomonas hydrangeae]
MRCSHKLVSRARGALTARGIFGGMDAASGWRLEQNQNFQDTVSSTSRGSP